MMNLFSSFDPLIFSMPLNMMINSLLIINILMIKKFINNQLMNKIKLELIKLIMNLNFKNNKSISILFMSVMLSMLIYNLSNLLPMNVSQTSNISMNLNITLILWMMNIILVMNKNNIFFLNLTPPNSPIMINLVINLIEMNSLFFQILSLTMRLTINIMLGHIIIHLINNYILILMYMLVEMLIIIIQTYIFTMLNLLNFNNNL